MTVHTALCWVGLSSSDFLFVLLHASLPEDDNRQVRGYKTLRCMQLLMTAGGREQWQWPARSPDYNRRPNLSSTVQSLTRAIINGQGNEHYPSLDGLGVSDEELMSVLEADHPLTILKGTTLRIPAPGHPQYDAVSAGQC